jgi:coatomer subunit beta'
MIKSFETGNNPVRCAKFIVRKQWIVAGTDDMKMRVFNYNTMDKVKEWDAHNDYIRFIEVHPNRPFIFSCSDDMSIKMWDWDKDFECSQVFEGHSHYVMMIRVNPRDTNTFASASLDKTIKVWSVTTATPHFSLEGSGGHDKGVNCVDYYPGGDKPYLLSGADDRTIKIWDYQTKACLQTLEGHSHNVTSVCFHPRLPLIISASEDGTVRLWHATTYRPETTLNYGLERAWCIAVTKDSNKVAIGYDEGTIVVKLGNERPVASLDTNGAKLVWAQGHDIQTISLKGLSKTEDVELVDGERILALNPRDLGACEVYPQVVQHNCNGSFIVVCGDGEYIIYTSTALRNKSFGSALDFAWSALGSGDYAVRESVSRVRTYKNFKEHKTVSLPIASADALYGGAALGIKGPECVVFFDWEDAQFIRKIDVSSPSAVYWNEAGDSLVISTPDCFYVLKYHRDVVAQALASGQANQTEDGVDGAFDLVATINEKVVTGQWVGECFLFTSDARKLNYVVGGEVMTLAHLHHSMYLLGFVPKEDRVFLVDKAYQVVSYRLRLSVLSYQTAVVRQDFVTANALLPLIPASEYAGVARFLESQGFKEEALAVTTDPDHKFELAIELKRMEIAHEVLRQEDAAAAKQRQQLQQSGQEDGSMHEDSTDTQSKWRRLGDLALLHGDLALAEACAVRSQDLSGLLLLYSSAGNRAGMVRLAQQAKDAGRLNVGFVASLLTGRVEDCLSLLVEHQRFPEAALMARTYLPSKVSEILPLWKADLKKTNAKAAAALADPSEYANLFPNFDIAMRVEEMFLKAREHVVSASLYSQAKGDLDLDLIALVKQQMLAQQEQAAHHPQQAEEEEEEEQGGAEASPLRDSSVLSPAAPSAELAEREEAEEEEEEDVARSPVNSPSVSPTKPTAPTSAPVSPSKPSAAARVVKEEYDEDAEMDALLAEEAALILSSPAKAPAVAEAGAGAEAEADEYEGKVLEDAPETQKTAPAAAAPADEEDIDFEEGEDW